MAGLTSGAIIIFDQNAKPQLYTDLLQHFAPDTFLCAALTAGRLETGRTGGEGMTARGTNVLGR